MVVLPDELLQIIVDYVGCMPTDFTRIWQTDLPSDELSMGFSNIINLLIVERKRFRPGHLRHVPLWNISRASSELRRLSMPLIWHTVQICTVRELGLFEELARISPQGLPLVHNFHVRISRFMDKADYGAPPPNQLSWRDCSEDVTQWIFVRRPDVLDSMLRARGLRDSVPGIPNWAMGDGPDDDGEIPNLRSAEAVMLAMEHLLEGMTKLERFSYHSAWLPLSASSCEALCQRESLRVLHMGPQGEHHTKVIPHTPYETIFNTKTCSLRSLIFSATMQLRRPDHAAVFSDELAGLDRACIYESRFERYPQEIGDDGLSTLSYDSVSTETFERELAVDWPNILDYIGRKGAGIRIPHPDQAAVHLIRALVAGQERIKLFIPGSHARYIVRIPQIFFLWVKIKVSVTCFADEEETQDPDDPLPVPVFSPRTDPYYVAARAVREACCKLAANKADRKLTVKDVVTLGDQDVRLRVYEQWLREKSIQRSIRDAWNDLVKRGEDRPFDDYDLAAIEIPDEGAEGYDPLPVLWQAAKPEKRDEVFIALSAVTESLDSDDDEEDDEGAPQWADGWDDGADGWEDVDNVAEEEDDSNVGSSGDEMTPL